MVQQFAASAVRWVSPAHRWVSGRSDSTIELLTLERRKVPRHGHGIGQQTAGEGLCQGGRGKVSFRQLRNEG